MKVLFPLQVALVCAAVASAQQTGSMSPPSTGAPAGNIIQPIGANDLLNVSVYDAPELTRPLRVASDGMVKLPMLTPIRAQGLLPAELESHIKEALRNQNVMVDPLVTVTIAEVQSRPIRVTGAVRTPLTFQVTGRVTLLDAISRAGGVSETAGSELLLTHPALGSARELSPLQRVSLGDLLSGKSEDNLVLVGGEQILVPEAEQIYVVGSVRKPGVFMVHDRSTPSVLKLLALTEGLTPYHQKQAYIYRDDSAHKNKEEITVDLNRIMRRKAPDVELKPNDVLYIPENGARRDWTAAIERVLTLGGAGIGAALLYR